MTYPVPPTEGSSGHLEHSGDLHRILNSIEAMSVGDLLAVKTTSPPDVEAGTSSGGGPTLVVKSVDETVNNTDLMQDDDELTFAIAADETWVGEFVVFAVGDASADIDLALTAPSGAEILYNSFGPRTSDVILTHGANNHSTSGSQLTHGTNTVGTTIAIKFRVFNGATAGSITLQWAQNVATAADTTVKKGSHLTAHKV